MPGFDHTQTLVIYFWLENSTEVVFLHVLYDKFLVDLEQPATDRMRMPIPPAASTVYCFLEEGTLSHHS